VLRNEGIAGIFFGTVVLLAMPNIVVAEMRNHGKPEMKAAPADASIEPADTSGGDVKPSCSPTDPGPQPRAQGGMSHESSSELPAAATRSGQQQKKSWRQGGKVGKERPVDLGAGLWPFNFKAKPKTSESGISAQKDRTIDEHACQARTWQTNLLAFLTDPLKALTELHASFSRWCSESRIDPGSSVGQGGSQVSAVMPPGDSLSLRLPELGRERPSWEQRCLSLERQLETCESPWYSPQCRIPTPLFEMPATGTWSLDLSPHHWTRQLCLQLDRPSAS
jgi:hypothetical protein